MGREIVLRKNVYAGVEVRTQGTVSTRSGGLVVANLGHSFPG